MRDSPEIAAAKRRLEDQATELPNWARQLLNYIAQIERERAEGLAHTSLTFNALRTANLARLPQFKNKHGGLAHSHPEGRDWSPAQWLQAVMGELGEYANERKKFERGDLSAEEFAVKAAKELADVQTYLDILAYQVGVDLGAATVAKFNEVSIRVGCDVRLGPDALPKGGEHG